MDYWRLHIADIPCLRKNLEALRKYIDEGGDLEKGREFFFSSTLLGYYDAMWEGLNIDVGHILYRLSDFLEEDKRKRMMIYPSSDGSILDTEAGQWDSLEDWRQQWEKLHLVIPEFDFQKRIEGKNLLQLPEKTSRP